MIIKPRICEKRENDGERIVEQRNMRLISVARMRKRGKELKT